ncbi:hypothetical protein A4X09_0g5417 [Tilletia walkeri]|uniref:Uncharacterized protein n=1 Tax=Tilletia walkeri TaxID=117179 RepID=A0A8X7N7F3_9BASI|nr:hypothetical protein A4X09_0g5417 [Tilletia walkeri]
MAKKKSAAAKKSTSTSATTAPPAPSSSTTTTAAAAKPAPAIPTHATLQVALLRCAALCVASKATLRANEMPISNTPLDELPTHEQILNDLRVLFKRLGTTANALALAVKVSAAAASTKGSSASQAGAGGPGNPLVGLDSESIAAAQDQLGVLTTELIPKLVYVSRKVTKESFVTHTSEQGSQTTTTSYQHMGGLGVAFDKAINRAVRETIDTVDAFIECFMDLKTRSALLASEQARYKAALEFGDELDAPPRPPAYPRMENLSPAELRKRALIRYDALYKLCERLADPAPSGDCPILQSDYKHLSNKEGVSSGGDADADDLADLHYHDSDVGEVVSYMEPHLLGLPRDNWDALQRFHSTRDEQLHDAVREIRDVLRWAKRNGIEGGAGADKGGEEIPIKKEKEEKAKDEEDHDSEFEDMFDDMALDEYAPADVDRARRALPVVENVLKAHDLIGLLFRDPKARATFEKVSRNLFDNMSEHADELVTDVDNLLGYCIYAGDPVTEARQAEEEEEEESGKTWEETQKERKEHGDHRPYDPQVAEQLARDAEDIFADHLIDFARTGKELTTQGMEVAVKDDVLSRLAEVVEKIETTCKEAVGLERYNSFMSDLEL